MDKNILVYARNAIKRKFNLETEPIEIPLEWNIKQASFVTLTLDGKLRGCIGSLEANTSLKEDVQHNAVAAAFYDPRFNPLTPKELTKVKIEVSILTPLKPIQFETENDILQIIVPFKMGLLLEYGFNRGTFLPQVWDYYPNPKDFFEHLKLKAGLKKDFFDPNIKIFYYEVEKCQE